MEPTIREYSELLDNDLINDQFYINKYINEIKYLLNINNKKINNNYNFSYFYLPGAAYKPKNYSIDKIIRIVCDYFNLSPEMIHTKTRKEKIVKGRQIAMYFSRRFTNLSFSKIGAKIGGKDHATVSHACKTVNNLIDAYKWFKIQIEEIENKIKNE